MQITVVFGYDLLILTGCLLLQIPGQQICKKDQYTIVASDGSFVRCLHCGTCRAGSGLDPPCGSQIPATALANIGCKDCPAEKFSAEYDSAPCRNCQQCAKHEIVAAPCTNSSDRVCNGTCEKGYFFSKKDSTHSCQKCSYCCSDGKDEEVTECTNQGLNAFKQHCRSRPDKDCGPSPSLASPTGLGSGTKASKGGGLSTTTIIVIGTSGVIIVFVLSVAIICVYRRKKKQQSNAAAQNYASNGPGLEGTVKYSNNSSYTPSNTVTPAGSHNILTAGTQSGARLNTIVTNEQEVQTASSSLPENKPPASVPSTATPSIPVPATNKSAAKGNNSGTNVFTPVIRQLSQESQKSGDGSDAGSGRCSRSPSTSSFTESLKRRLSVRKDDPLVHNEEEDTDRAQGPIAIMKEPTSPQEAKEGSNVELVFKCKARDNRKLVYQWFKDNTELHGKNQSMLVIKPVTLSDFGCYTCRASCKDNPSDVVKSSPADLDVTPRDGTRYKYLNEIDPTTQDRIGALLTQRIHGLGGWRQIAFKYEMDHLGIKSLQDDPKAGKNTLEYLDSHNPYLTVYDFCKALKEYDIGRFDIVKELLGHLSFSSSKVFV